MEEGSDGFCMSARAAASRPGTIVPVPLKSPIAALSFVLFTVAVFAVTLGGLERQSALRSQVIVGERDRTFEELQQRGQEDFLRLSDELRDIVTVSHDMFVETGFSRAYLDAHLAFLDVAGKPGERTVEWMLRLGEFSVPLTDVITFAPGVGRVHSLRAEFGRAHDILPTLTLAEAGRVLRNCVGGSYEEPQISLRAPSPEGDIRLFIRALAADERIATLDLETGVCTVRSRGLH